MAATSEDSDRKQALKRLRKRRGLVPGIATYVVVNVVLIVIWALTGRGYFWPGWVLGFWGFFLVLDAWTAWSPFVRRPITDEDIDREVERVRRPSGRGGAVV